MQGKEAKNREAPLSTGALKIKNEVCFKIKPKKLNNKSQVSRENSRAWNMQGSGCKAVVFALQSLTVRARCCEEPSTALRVLLTFVVLHQDNDLD